MDGKRLIFLFSIILLCSCVSYYDGYEQSYGVETYTGYNYYNSPLRLRGLNENDFYMLDNYPSDYLNTQLWSATSDLSRFAVHNFFQILAH